MSDPSDLAPVLGAELMRYDIGAQPVVIPTPWDVGAVVAYLFKADPVTFVDSGLDSPEAHDALGAALAAQGLKPSDVDRVIVTHGHSDHFGGARWLQDESGCEVYLHPADVEAMSDPQRRARELFGPLGFTEELYARAGRRERALPAFTSLTDGSVFEVGGETMRIEHHPGHSAGHVWVVHEPSGAMFVGDYLLATTPTTPGMEPDPTHPSGRTPLLELYQAGIGELARRDAPMLFPGHGPPIRDHKALIRRRLRKSERRTERVLEGLARSGEVSAAELGRLLYGDRTHQRWGVIADLVGRVDLLVARGRVAARLEEDGVWRFRAIDEKGT